MVRPPTRGLPGAKRDLPRARHGRDVVSEAMRKLKAVAPEGGSYVSESNFFEPAWQRSFWGDHHDRLRAVKAKYDRMACFSCITGWGAKSGVRMGSSG